MKPKLETLTEEQRERLSKLESELCVDKLASSFMIEDRDGAGRRKQTFYSASVSRGRAGSPTTGWSTQEAQLASCLLSRHVVQTTYRDALKRRVLPKEVVSSELPGILEAYDVTIAALMSNGSEDAKDTP